MDEAPGNDSRDAKLQKQREIIKRKQKEKHAHQVLLLQPRSLSTEPNIVETNQLIKEGVRRKPEKEMNAWSSFAYDGPQSYELDTAPDDPLANQVQVIRVDSSSETSESIVPFDKTRHIQCTPSNDSATLRRAKKKSRKQKSVEQESDEASITRSSTLMSSLDQEVLACPSGAESGNVADSNTSTSLGGHKKYIKNKSPSTLHTFTDNPVFTDHHENEGGRDVQSKRGRVLDWTENLTREVENRLPSTSSPGSGDGIQLAAGQPISSFDSIAMDSLKVPDAIHCPDDARSTKGESVTFNNAVDNLKSIDSTHSSVYAHRISTVSSLNERRRRRTSGGSISRKSDLRHSVYFPDPAENREAFVTRPALKGMTVRCQISRDKRGMDRGVYSNYYLHTEKDDCRFFLLAARRRKRSTTSNYIISYDATNLSRKTVSLAGKLRSNFFGTHFTVYGCSHDKNEVHFGSAADRSTFSVRSSSESFEALDKLQKQKGVFSLHEIAAVIYETNVLGFKGPRKMIVILPKLSEGIDEIEFEPSIPGTTILESWKRNSMNNLLEYHNKSPVWNEGTQSYVLNFYGRVTQASVKNFQIVEDEEDEHVVMQFGRIAEDLFTMDYSYPMNALQAFGIALSSFDGKLACE